MDQVAGLNGHGNAIPQAQAAQVNQSGIFMDIESLGQDGRCGCLIGIEYPAGSMHPATLDVFSEADEGAGLGFGFSSGNIKTFAGDGCNVTQGDQLFNGAPHGHVAGSKLFAQFALRRKLLARTKLTLKDSIQEAFFDLTVEGDDRLGREGH